MVGGNGGGSTENDDEDDEAAERGGQQTDVAIHNVGTATATAAVGAELELKSSENCLPNTLQVKFKSLLIETFTKYMYSVLYTY